MYSEKTEIVDVVAITENNSTTYSLSKKAGDLFEAAKAGTVIRRHDVNETGNPDYKDYAYVGLSEVKLNGSGYSFKFASGDEFTASDADAYPSASSISDAIAGGSSNAIYITVGQTLTDEEFEEVKQTIIDGGHVVCAYATVEGALNFVVYSNLSLVNGNEIWFQFSYVSVEVAGTLLYVDYCVLSASGWGSNSEFKFALAQYTPAPDPGE